MDAKSLRTLEPELKTFLARFADCFEYQALGYLAKYVGGHLSELPRKSVEPMALEAGVPPRSLQEFLTHLKWDERAARKTAQNSSLPPSAEHPHAKTSGAGAVETGEDHAAGGGDAAERKPLKKKRGGQRGHPKQERTLLPLEQCADVVPLKPKRCRGCGEKLRGDDPDPWRHQVWELPQPQPLVTEYQRHRLTCSCCGVTTGAELPEGVPEYTSGPRLLAVTAVLMGLSSIKNTVSPVEIAHRAGSQHTVLCCPSKTCRAG